VAIQNRCEKEKQTLQKAWEKQDSLSSAVSLAKRGRNVKSIKLSLSCPSVWGVAKQIRFGLPFRAPWFIWQWPESIFAPSKLTSSKKKKVMWEQPWCHREREMSMLHGSLKFLWCFWSVYLKNEWKEKVGKNICTRSSSNMAEAQRWVRAVCGLRT
jgi:hypothetical protein